LPEPPFWFATTMVFIRKAPLFLRGGAEVGNHHGCAGATRLIRTYAGHTQQSYKNSRFLESENFPFDILTSRSGAPRQPCGAGVMSLPRLWPLAEHARHGCYRPFRPLCLRRLGLYGNSACAVARRIGTPSGQPEASSPSVARITSPPVATEAAQDASSSPAAPRRCPCTA
jgi:hypothetical protein